MAQTPRVHQVEVVFAGSIPLRQVRRASGVSDVVVVDGSTLRCLVVGSFQPFLEALEGHEVASLVSTATDGVSLEGPTR